jgi:hypothetical protein
MDLGEPPAAQQFHLPADVVEEAKAKVYIAGSKPVPVPPPSGSVLIHESDP